MHLSDLKNLHVGELLDMAVKNEVDGANRMRKQELIFALLKNQAKKGESIYGGGTLEVLPDGFGFLRSPDTSYLAGTDDIYVSPSQIRRFNLHTGDTIEGEIRTPKDGERYFALVKVDKVNDEPPENSKHKILFENLTPYHPTEHLKLERDIKAEENITGRIIDIIAPIGKGQRGLIVAPPKAGKTVMLQHIAHALTANHPEVSLIVLLIDERPEEVTEMSRSVRGEVVASTPLFLGANPAIVRKGPHVVARPCGPEEDAGRALLRSLGGDVRARAVLDAPAPIDFVVHRLPEVPPVTRPGEYVHPLGAFQHLFVSLEDSAKDALTLDLAAPAGVARADLDTGQRALLDDLIGLYVGRLPASLAAPEMTRLEAAGLLLHRPGHSAWINGITDDSRNVQPGDLFVALRGERVDGHAYASAAVRAGASGCLLDHAVPGIDGLGGQLEEVHQLHRQGEITLQLDTPLDRKSTRLNSSHMSESRMPSSA